MGNDKFSTLWFAGLTLALSLVFVWKGGKIAFKREIVNPLVEARGGKAIGIGLAIAAVGLLGAAMGLVEALKFR